MKALHFCYHSLMLLLSLLTLSGCITGAFLAGGAVTSVVLTEPRSLQVIKQDEIMSYQVNRQLMQNHSLARQAHIVATSYNRIILLTGQAPDDTLREQANYYAENTPQVRQVFNYIALGSPVRPWQRTRDTTMTATVRARLLATTGLRSNHFKVVTENGTVFILGIATPQQAELATAAVQHTSGVKRVVKLIETVQV